MKKENLLSKTEMRKVLGGNYPGTPGTGNCDSQCEAIGSECGTAENKGKCEWVSDSSCTGGGFGLCFFPIAN